MTEMNFDKLKSEILVKLKENLSHYLYYHCPEHTERVINVAIYIAEKENVSEKEKMLIKIAALFHDIGFLYTYANHEEESCRVAIEELKNHHFSITELDSICSMIMATQIPQIITNKLDAILADADLEYIGTDDFDSISTTLYQELKHRNPKLTIEAWNQIQINFFEKHKFHTDYAKNNLETKKQEHLTKLKGLL